MKRKGLMKIKQILAICGAVAALVLSAGQVSAQNDNGGGGGGGGGGFGGGGGGGFDPAAFQQRMMDNVREQLNFTNDADWSAVQPLVQKVMDARRDAGGAGFGRLFRRRNADNNGGGGGGGNRFGPPPSPEAQALQSALDNNAPDAQVKDLLTKYQAAQKTKQAALKQAQENLRAVLTPRQEAQATLLGLID
jgi:Spy/CpxP family protein refolding chaperone